jgi:hypothetical protein
MERGWEGQWLVSIVGFGISNAENFRVLTSEMQSNSFITSSEGLNILYRYIQVLL